VWNAEDARDLVQEAFIRLWRMRDRVRMETVEPLVYRIAVNLASSKRRSRKLWRFVSMEALRHRSAETTAADQAIDAEERKAAVRAAMEELPEKLRRVVLLCELTDMTHAQIGEALGIPPGTVGSRRHAALARLEKILGPIVENRDDERIEA
jgi:RNA polymerase sigma-70 factor (ECF subfamily)